MDDFSKKNGKGKPNDYIVELPEPMLSKEQRDVLHQEFEKIATQHFNKILVPYLEEFINMFETPAYLEFKVIYDVEALDRFIDKSILGKKKRYDVH